MAASTTFVAWGACGGSAPPFGGTGGESAAASTALSSTSNTAASAGSGADGSVTTIASYSSAGGAAASAAASSTAIASVSVTSSSSGLPQCTTVPAGTADDCYPFFDTQGAVCALEESKYNGCSGSPYFYSCYDGGAPPLSGCVDINDNSTNSTDYCCGNLTCVRYSGSDGYCQALDAGIPRAYGCLAGQTAGLPVGCVNSGSTYCCP